MVIDDGSSDDTVAVCQTNGADCYSHKYTMGNGAAIKSGIRHCGDAEILVFMDADGQHPPELIPSLLEKLDEGYGMCVAARTHKSQASIARLTGNRFFNWLASRITGHDIKDLTSGFRAIRASYAREFAFLLPNGFSYPTTLTMAMFRSASPVTYVPFEAAQRGGRSHIKPLQDFGRFFLLIFRIGFLYSPLKMMTPVSLAIFAISIAYYGYTFLTMGRLTNMTVFLAISGVVTLLMALLAEQLTAILYKDHSFDHQPSDHESDRH